MKTILLSLISFYLTLSNVSAQDKISSIRSHYKQYTRQIADCKNSAKPCQLYTNTYSINSDNQPWRASGQYQKTTSFWYDDTPQNCDECGKNGIEVLKLVTANTTSGLTGSYEEWLYQKGELIFYYVKNTGEDETELRYYYHNGSLIRYIKDGNLLDGDKAKEKDNSMIITKALNLQKSFLLGFK